MNDYFNLGFGKGSQEGYCRFNFVDVDDAVVVHALSASHPGRNRFPIEIDDDDDDVATFQCSTVRSYGKRKRATFIFCVVCRLPLFSSPRKSRRQNHVRPQIKTTYRWTTALTFWLDLRTDSDTGKRKKPDFLANAQNRLFARQSNLGRRRNPKNNGRRQRPRQGILLVDVQTGEGLKQEE